MSPAFLMFSVALAAILIWAVVSRIMFERRVNDRIKRERALDERAADYRAKLNAKSAELQKQLADKAPKRAMDLEETVTIAVNEEVNFALAKAVSGSYFRAAREAAGHAPRRFLVAHRILTSDAIVPIVDPHDIEDELMMRISTGHRPKYPNPIEKPAKPKAPARVLPPAPITR
ncbi:hypothetical protein BPNPMPFG_005433 [Mesorhizobium sp. AR07]|uniref:hypothetical protein n=1 Tax=Mesorhizobium sp. AR07 TaxID=2865838 RepID=UPI0021601D7D|nr:hypothetical protein [Mesorhizobium sp. AR07]UVK43624.1 hypothetical protein BPNPMPFG_005433 [Mesorhizobium sp. AR07]